MGSMPTRNPDTSSQTKIVRDTETQSRSYNGQKLTSKQDQSHVKKQSISQPFNFQHLSHTRRKHVPGLPTVDEKGQSRIQTNSIADGTTTGTRPTTPLLKSPAIGSHHSSSRSVDVTQGRHQLLVGGGRPRAASCQTGNGIQRSPSSMSQVVRLSVNNPNIPADSETIPPIASQVKHCTPSEVKYRAQQPLPALPQSLGSRRNSRRMTVDSQLSSSTSGETSSSSRPDSRRSSNVRSITAVPWSSLNERASTIELSEASWEEDVDFCYEQEAESTCDFHWYEHFEEMDGGFRLSKFIPPNDGPRASAFYAPQVHHQTSPPQRKASSIVGHRGFQHARTTSVIMEAPDHEMPKDDSKPMFGPELLHLSTSLASISDSASTRTGSSGHHKSNSCASFESGVHPAPSSDNGHASIGSLNSVPELMHSSTARSSTTTTEAVTPQEPASVVPSPRVQQTPVCDIMRKPSTLSNRAILQAGRVVQRGRGSAPAKSRMSRVPSTQAQKPLVEGEEVMTWI